MHHQQPDTSNEPMLHQALAKLLHAQQLRFVEMDQLIFPENTQEKHQRAGQPSQSLVFIQVLDADKRAVASGSYTHTLAHGRSPFIGPRAVPGSARQGVLDDLVKALSATV